MFTKSFRSFLEVDDGLSIGSVSDGFSESGEEVVEAADPQANEELGAEEEELTDPLEDEEDSAKTESDRAFAQMRRDLEEANRKNQMADEALGMLFDGDTYEKSLQLRALAENRPVEEISAEIDEQNKKLQLEDENEELQRQLDDLKAISVIEKGVAEVSKIDPNFKLSDVDNEQFASYLEAGLTFKQAYYAYKAEEQATKYVPPKAPPTVNESHAENEYYTSEEIDNMTQTEIRANREKVRKSLAHLK